MMLAKETTRPPGLRERKAAQTRLAVAASLSRRLVDADLSDISVEDLAADANISRMTFFNYFPAKRDAVDLVMIIHIFETQAAIARHGLRGREAIELVFSMTADLLAEAPQRMRRISAHHLARPPRIPMPTLTRAERLILAPDLDGDLELVRPGYLFARLIDEAREDGLEIQGSSFELSHYLGSLWNGASLIGHVPEDNTDFKQLYRRHARRALGLLGDPELKDPRPPRIPKRYREWGKKR